jgi:hypothetical protein
MASLICRLEAPSYVGAITKSDQVDVFAESCLDQMGAAQRSSAEKDDLVAKVLRNRGQDVRDRVVTPDLVVGDTEPCRFLLKVGL